MFQTPSGRVSFILGIICISIAANSLCAETNKGEITIQELKALSLEELLDLEVTTVQRRDSTVGQSPAAISVITPQDIRRSGATTIPELFRRVPGMNVARVDANKWAVSARGFNDRFANKLLVQIDGRTVYSPIFSGVFWDAVDYPLEDIERIEIIRGPGASMWGANAVNGIINIITKSANDTQGGFLSGGGGTEERGFGTIRYGGKLSDTAAYRVYSKGFSRDESFGLSPAPFDGWWGIRTGARIDWQPSDANDLTLQSDYFHSDSERIDFRPQRTPPYRFTNAENEISDGANVLGRWNHSLDGDSSWTLQAGWDHVNRRSTSEILVFSMDTFDVDFQHEFTAADRHHVVWGMGYRATYCEFSDSGDNGFILDWDPNHRLLHNPSVFLQDEIALTENLGLTLGTKLEHNELTGVEVQPTARLLWTPIQNQAVWAAASRAVRTPTLFEDQRAVTQTPAPPGPGGTVFPRIVANESLRAEEVLAYELGYRVQVNKTFSVDSALFYNVYDDLKVFVPGGTTTNGAPPGTTLLQLSHGNEMHGESYGFELGAKWEPVDRWQLYGAYTLLKMNLHANPGLPARTRDMSEAAERQSPQQQFYLQSSWDLPGRIQLDLIGRFVDQLTGFQQRVEEYVSIDLRIGWQPVENVMLEIVGQNLLDNHHLESSGSVLAGPLHEIQRGIYGKLTWWF